MGSADQITIGRVSGFKEWIRITAQRFDLPPAVLAGLVATESGGDPWAMRAEELYRYLVGDDPHEKLIKPPTSTQATEFYTQKLSWGLCQIMGATGRELSHKGWHSQNERPGYQPALRSNVFGPVPQAPGRRHAPSALALQRRRQSRVPGQGVGLGPPV